MFRKTKRIISCVLSIALLVSLIPDYNIQTAGAAETETNEPYSYVMFAGGGGESLKIEADNLTVNGNIHTNGKLIADTQNSNVNGTIFVVSGSAITGKLSENKIVKSDRQDTIIVQHKIKSACFTDNCNIYNEALDMTETNLNISKSLYSEDSVHAYGNINLNAAVGAAESISLEGDSLNANNAVIYSEAGNIGFKFFNTNITGLVYAPNGKVTIDSTHVQINGVIIAKEIEVVSDNVNLNYNDTTASFVGSASESIYPDVVQLTDGVIDGEYFCKAIYPYLLLYNFSTEELSLSDDYDNDGLTLIEEYNYDTNPFMSDTDGDGLSDYEEAVTYGTKPCYEDTDLDGMSDGTEISGGLNPLITDSDQDEIPDSEETVTQKVRIELANEIDIKETLVKPEVEITGKGDFSGQIYAEDINDNQLFSDLNYIIGHPFDFIHDDSLEFESSKLTFAVDESALQDNNLDDLAIAWYDMETNEVHILDTEHDQTNNTISASVDHYSVYFVVNLKDYLNAIINENTGGIKDGKADVVFLVNTAFYMDGAMDNIKSNLIQFLDDLEENNVDAQLGLVEFGGFYTQDVEIHNAYSWFSDTDSCKSAISVLIRAQELYEDYTANDIGFYDAVNSIKDMDFRSDTNKYIIMITDEEIYLSSIHDNIYKLSLEHELTSFATEEELNEQSEEDGGTVIPDIGIPLQASDGICFSVITYFSGYSLFGSLVDETGGVYGNVHDSFTDNLEALISGKENTGDGCYINLSNGFIVKLDMDPTLGDEGVDTDKDGISDIDELGCLKTYRYYDIFSGEYAEYEAWSFYSNPAASDTDGDGLTDDKDIAPCSFDVRVIYEDDYCIGFNTSRTWHKIDCNAIDYMLSKEYYDTPVSDNTALRDFINYLFDSYPSYLLSTGEMTDTEIRYNLNAGKNFTISELEYIGYVDNEGSKLYLNNKSSEVRNNIFEKLFHRESRYYHHKNSSRVDGAWEEVPSDYEGGYFKGYVVSEYDAMFSTKILTMNDIYDTLDELSEAVAGICIVITGAYYLGYTIASLQVLNYYISNYGIYNGIQYAYYIGAAGMENGIITFIQQDMADGDPSADNLAVFEEKFYLEVSRGYIEIPTGITAAEYLQYYENLYLYDNILGKSGGSVASSYQLRINMIEAGVEVPAYRNAAHHIVAGGSPKASVARDILEQYDIDINNAVNGVFLPTVKDVSSAAYHPSLHTNAYYNKVNGLLENAESREKVTEILQDICEQLLDGTFIN